jgi:carboxylesterase
LPAWYRLRHVAYALGLSRWFAMKEREPFGLKNDKMRERVRRQLEQDGASEVGPRSVSLMHVRESERLSRRFIGNVARSGLPLEVQHAREDEVCSLASVQRVLARLPNARCLLHVLDNSYHMVSADNDRQLVADHLAAFAHSLVCLRRTAASRDATTVAR